MIEGLEGIRETAKRHRRLKFTALLHHITPSLLVESFYDLNKTAAVGVGNTTRSTRYGWESAPFDKSAEQQYDEAWHKL